uniref:phospholipase A and acyltransferase 3-like n=1 Tax=Pristiophorus japonicus TaxID=55135 RepID=UPI00398F7D66
MFADDVFSSIHNSSDSEAGCAHMQQDLGNNQALADKWQSLHREKPGDLIEIFRSGFQHWAIYVGDGEVIHLTEGGGSAELSLRFSSATLIAVVKREPLSKVAGNDDYRINNSSDEKWDPLPVDQIIGAAKKWVGKTVKYKVTTANCEHFVNGLRYGKKVSFQVEKMLEAVVAGSAAGGGAITGSAFGPIGTIVGGAIGAMVGVIAAPVRR